MAFSPEHLVALRKQLNLADDADEAAIVAAFAERIKPTPEPVAAMRKQLGLADDADEEAVLAAVTERLKTPTGEPVKEPVAASSGIPGTFVIDQATYEALRVQASRGDEAYKIMAADRRDRAIEAAVRDGKIARARVKHWRSSWDRDPEGVEQALTSMPKNLVPVAASGFTGTGDAEWDEFEHLFPPTGSES